MHSRIDDQPIGVLLKHYPNSRRWLGVADHGRLMPALPFLEDRENVVGVVEAAQRAGAAYILPSLGVTLRDHQRDYFYQRPDALFPGVAERYRRAYGERYVCSPLKQRELERAFSTICRRSGLATRVPRWKPLPEAKQLTLF